MNRTALNFKEDKLVPRFVAHTYGVSYSFCLVKISGPLYTEIGAVSLAVFKELLR